MKKKNIIKNILLLSTFLFLGCDKFLNETKTTEHVVKFRMIPSFFGEEMAYKVINEGQQFFVFPWERIYRFDTRVRAIRLDRLGDEISRKDNHIEIRLSDGNLVLVKIIAEYQILKGNENLIKIVKNVVNNDQKINDLVKNILISNIDMSLGTLTSDNFLNNVRRQEAMRIASYSILKILKEYGIKLLSINLQDYEFARLLKNGLVDNSYQNKISEIKKINAKIKRK